MAKRRSWFGWIKRLFICEAKAKPEKKPRRLRWVFRRLKLRQQIANCSQEKKTLNEATEDQRKHAMNVAIATAAAAEAAVAAAKAAAEVVRMAGDAFTSQHFVVEKCVDPNSAAIKIQSAFRAYLARKALRALKALVRIQAIVRGRAVRRKVSPLLKYNKASTSSLIQRNKERKHWYKTKDEFKVLKHSKIECNGWDNSALTKEDIKAIWLKKQEGVMKRERMLKYSRSHRERRSPLMFMEPLYTKDIGMRSCRLEHWGGESTKSTKLKLRNLQRQEDSCDGQDSPFSFPRRSFSRLEQSLMDDESWFQRSNGFLQPYMNVTESSKQKFRSLSTPRRQSITGLTDSWFDINDKKDGDKVSLWSSFVSETSKFSSLKKSSLSKTTNQHYVKS